MLLALKKQKKGGNYTGKWLISLFTHKGLNLQVPPPEGVELISITRCASTSTLYQAGSRVALDLSFNCQLRRELVYSGWLNGV